MPTIASEPGPNEPPCHYSSAGAAIAMHMRRRGEAPLGFIVPVGLARREARYREIAAQAALILAIVLILTVVAFR